MNENFNKIAPTCFFYKKNVKNLDMISEALHKFYLPLDPIDVRSFNTLGNLYGDGVIGYPVHKFVHFISHFPDVYYYKFTYIGRYSMFNYPQRRPYGKL